MVVLIETTHRYAMAYKGNDYLVTVRKHIENSEPSYIIFDEVMQSEVPSGEEEDEIIAYLNKELGEDIPL
jgi:hypothetical protein